MQSICFIVYLFVIYSFSTLSKLQNVYFIDIFRWNFQGQNVLISPSHILSLRKKRGTLKLLNYVIKPCNWEKYET